ncbi:MAG: cytidine deaminase [Rickettsiales bacterium]|nr:cytidine deaminase [Rickettsiales bacterium]|tara:strand:- start:404 stop:826 length:423 start_codon:yes stop_codon:yes gene_type:complete
MADYQHLYDTVLAFIEERYKGAPDGAAGVILENDEIIIGTAPDYYNHGVSVCHETGAFLEAYKRDIPIKASMCLYKDETDQVFILPPCGVCRERLRDHGTNIVAAVPSNDGVNKFEMISLEQLCPHDWVTAYENQKKNSS